MIFLSKIIPTKKVYLFLVLLPVFYSGSLTAQDTNSIVTNQIWLDYNYWQKISESFQFRGKIASKIIFPYSWYKVSASAEINYYIPKFMFKKLKYNEKVYAGVDYYYAFFNELSNVMDLSFYQGYTLSWPNRKKFSIYHNVELGEDFQWEVQDWKYSFGLNIGYEATLMYNFQGNTWDYGKGLYLTLSAKFWWNLIAKDVFNDVVRITPGVGYHISPKWKVAFYIGYNYTRNLSKGVLRANNILYRIRVYHIIK